MGQTGGFDDVDVERLRRRRTVKWSLYGPDVLAAWVAEMDFDVAPPVRAAIQAAVDREDFGYGRVERLLRLVRGEPATDWSGVEGIEVCSPTACSRTPPAWPAASGTAAPACARRGGPASTG